MATTHLTPSEKQRRYRNRLTRQGLRPIQIWVPDMGAPDFVKECRRQSLLVAGDPREGEVMDFLEAAADWDEA